MSVVERARIASVYLRLPRQARVAIAVGVSIAFSELFTSITMALIHIRETLPYFVIPAVVPALVAGPICMFTYGLIDELEAARSEAQRLANTDLLTGVLNRRRFIEIAKDELARARRSAAPLSVLLLDIDDFKAINDRHGHDVGDAVLRRLSGICTSALPPEYPFARWGGEEFIALLRGAGPGDAIGIAMRVREAIAAGDLEVGGRSLRVTASIGVAADERDEDGLDTIISRADRAMYEAKRKGKNAAVCAA